MKIVYTHQARIDLTEIREFLRERSPKGLQSVVNDIIGLVEAIPDSISQGRQTPHPDVWEKISPKYRYKIPYYIKNGAVYILRIYDSRRSELSYEEIIDTASE